MSYKSPPSDEIEEISFHEAGHAVTMIAYGVKIYQITINYNPNREEGSMGRVTGRTIPIAGTDNLAPSSGDEALRSAMASVGGVVGQDYRKNVDFTGGLGDIIESDRGPLSDHLPDIIDLLKAAGTPSKDLIDPDNDAILREVSYRVKKVIVENHDLFTELAETLNKQRVKIKVPPEEKERTLLGLGGNDIDKIVKKHKIKSLEDIGLYPVPWNSRLEKE